jgi:DNA-directed RNA polymerase subunit K/omega
MAAAATTEDRGVNEAYLEMAKAKVPDVCVLVNAASKRAAELSRGARPLVPVLPQDDRSHMDIALLEIGEGKIILEPKGAAKA